MKGENDKFFGCYLILKVKKCEWYRAWDDNECSNKQVNIKRMSGSVITVVFQSGFCSTMQ
jgi:hypothetical protein